MSTILKTGLNYFPLETDFYSERNVQRLILKYGYEGFYVYLVTMSEIFDTNGYYAEYNDDFFHDIAFSTGVDVDRVKEILHYCVSLKIFNPAMAEKKEILTSEYFQKTFLEVKKRQKNIAIIAEYNLLKNKGSKSLMQHDVTSCSLSKEKKSKIKKESKEKEESEVAPQKGAKENTLPNKLNNNSQLPIGTKHHDYERSPKSNDAEIERLLHAGRTNR